MAILMQQQQEQEQQIQEKERTGSTRSGMKSYDIDATFIGGWHCTTGCDLSLFTHDALRTLMHDVLIGRSSKRGCMIAHRLVTHVEHPARINLSTSAYRILHSANAGGNSQWSEVLSGEILHRVFGAVIERTEMEISYAWGQWSKKTDFTVRIDEHIIAVSVTRAMKWNGTFTLSDGIKLLEKKLFGIKMSNRDVIREHRWERQILHILCQETYIISVLRSAWTWLQSCRPALCGETCVLITQCENTQWAFFGKVDMEEEEDTAVPLYVNTDEVIEDTDIPLHLLPAPMNRKETDTDLFMTYAGGDINKGSAGENRILEYDVEGEEGLDIMESTDHDSESAPHPLSPLNDNQFYYFFYGYPTLDEAKQHDAAILVTRRREDEEIQEEEEEEKEKDKEEEEKISDDGENQSLPPPSSSSSSTSFSSTSSSQRRRLHYQKCTVSSAQSRKAQSRKSLSRHKCRSNLCRFHRRIICPHRSPHHSHSHSQSA